MTDDAQLLRRYIDERSQEAFAELVRRHVNLVYFAALRRVGGDAHLADDVAQSVFSDLARKAPSLQGRTVLSGWLYTSTRFAAAQAVRTERRRRNHEQEAHTMRELHSAPDPDWNRLRPVIDETMDELEDREREAVLLRFFENLSFAEIGAKFSVSADAARMRVERALEKLGGLLAKRGIASTSVALASAFATQSGLAAPATLVTKIVASAFGHGAASAAATFGFWKAAVIAPVIVAAGVLVYERGAGKGEAEVTSAMAGNALGSPSTGANVNDDLASDNNAIAETVAVVPVTIRRPEVVQTAAGFAALSTMEKSIFKVFWEHGKISPETQPGRWLFRLRPSAPKHAEFVSASEALRSVGWIGIGPNGGVFLTNAGRDFCIGQGQEIDAFPSPAWAWHLVIPKFDQLSDSAQDILKTLWDHQAISPDVPPRRWGFRVQPGSAQYPAFEAGAAALLAHGLISIGAKEGVVMLTARGDVYCLDETRAIEARPAKVRVFRPLVP